MKAGAQDYIMKDNLRRLNTAIERELREAEVRRERRAVGRGSCGVHPRDSLDHRAPRGVAGG